MNQSEKTSLVRELQKAQAADILAVSSGPFPSTSLDDSLSELKKFASSRKGSHWLIVICKK